MTTFHHGQPNYYACAQINDLAPKVPAPPPRTTPLTTPPVIPPPRTTPPWREHSKPHPTTPLRSLPAKELPPPVPQKQKTNTIVGGPRPVQLVSPVLSLTKFVEEYSKQLPLQLKVLRGYCGPSSRLTISTDDMFNIHLVKRAKVVRVTDAHGSVYSVPLNSSIEFGLVYDPMDSRGSSEALAGFKLRVADILVLDVLPKVMCCLKECREGGKVILHDGEKLVIRGVQKSQKSRLKAKKSLKVFSLRTKQEMILQEDCPALFSTESNLIKMLLADLLEHVDDPFPSGAMVHLNAEIYQNPATSRKVHDIPDVLLSRMVDISSVIVETSLIASAVIDDTSRYLDNCTEEELHQMVDIPLEGGLMDIEVAVVEVDETDKLYEDTRGIYEEYSPLKVKPMRDLLSDRSAAAQTLFSTAVRTGWETHGIELAEPTYKYVGFTERKARGSVGSSAKRPDVSRSPSSSVRSVGSAGSGQEDPQQLSAPKVPPKLPPRGKEEGKEDEISKDKRDLTKKEPVKFPTLPRNFKAEMPPFKQTTPPMRPHPKETAPSPRPVSSRRHPPVESTEHVQTATSSRPIPCANGRGQRSTQRSRNDDSLLDGSVSSCEELSSDDTVFREDKGQWEGLVNRIKQIENRLTALEANGGGSGRDEVKVQQMESRIKVLEDLFMNLHGDSPYAQPEATPIYDVCGSSVEGNSSQLKQMTVQQVLSLLEAMDLHKYKDIFQMEHITGDILMELGDEELKEELGMESRLHRIRLLKVISGQHSPSSFLSREP